MTQPQIRSTVRVPGEDRLVTVLAVEPLIGPPVERERRRAVLTASFGPLTGDYERSAPASVVCDVCNHRDRVEAPEGERGAQRGSLIYAGGAS